MSEECTCNGNGYTNKVIHEDGSGIFTVCPCQFSADDLKKFIKELDEIGGGMVLDGDEIKTIN